MKKELRLLRNVGTEVKILYIFIYKIKIIFIVKILMVYLNI